MKGIVLFLILFSNLTYACPACESALARASHSSGFPTILIIGGVMVLLGLITKLFKK